MAQLPQLLASLLKSLQLPLQQAGVVPVQVVPQVPQLLVVVTSVQTPLQHLPVLQVVLSVRFVQTFAVHV